MCIGEIALEWLKSKDINDEERRKMTLLIAVMDVVEFNSEDPRGILRKVYTIAKSKISV